MERSERLEKNARRWRLIGSLAFLLGAFLIWERVSYNLHDFYAENFDIPTEEVLVAFQVDAEQRVLLNSAIQKMEAHDFWEASTDLDIMKEIGGPAEQIAEWYKTLCMIGLEEKERAIDLLTYFVEQPDFSFKKSEAEILLEQY